MLIRPVGYEICPTVTRQYRFFGQKRTFGQARLAEQWGNFYTGQQ